MSDYVSTNKEWKIGFISSEDDTCYVDCVCGEEGLFISGCVTICKCGRKYWTEFIAYRMETDDQLSETRKLERDSFEIAA